MDYSSADYICRARNGRRKRDRAELLARRSGEPLVRGGERLTLLGSGIAPMNGRVALTRIAELIGRDPSRVRTACRHSSRCRAPASSCLIGDFLSPLDAVNAAITRFAAAGLKGHMLQISRSGRGRPALRWPHPLRGRRGARRGGRQPGRDHPRRLLRPVPAPSRGSCRDRCGRSAGASASIAPIARRISLCWHSTARCRQTAGGEHACPSDRPTKDVLIGAGARFPRCCFALAARRTGGAADHLVAVAGDAAGAAPHRLPGDPAAARAGPRDETPARTPLWLILLRMTLAALVIFALAHPLLNPQARLAASRPDHLHRRRRLGSGARLAAAPGGARRSSSPRPSARTGR